MDKWTEFQITPISEFDKIAEENEFFFWHFVAKDVMTSLTIHPLGANYGKENALEIFKETFGIKIYQSFTEDSVDFLMNLGAPVKFIWRFGKYAPSFYGFNRKRLVYSTLETCYCIEGVSDIIFKTNPKLYDSFLSVEEEDLK